ncbi:MAG: hypothetical protein WBF13_11750 [Candidatus Zixiibacteriota bacterium]
MTTFRFLGKLVIPSILLILLLIPGDFIQVEKLTASDNGPVISGSPFCEDSIPRDFMISEIPPRPQNTITGTEFAEMTRGWTGRKRQEAALQELRSGNIPDFMRYFRPVQLQHRARHGETIRAVVWVTPDYLAIGSNEDFLRMPLTRPSAVNIAQEFGCVIPTRQIVDAVANQADFRFRPQPLPPGKMMRSSEYYDRHNQMIEEQHKGRPPGELVAGHKKDVVLTNRLLGPERIAIYGWHRKDGKPIQNLSTVHGARYADYSHGVRLVYGKVCVDGELRSIYEVLEDPKTAPVLSYEGLIPKIRRLMRW